jgi:hypothetical protein
VEQLAAGRAVAMFMTAGGIQRMEYGRL